MATTRIKICGITSLADALAAVAAGADALGFVFYPQSPRYVAPDTVARIVAQLPPFVSTVGLFVNASSVKIHQTMVQTGLQLVQLHGDEAIEDCCISTYPVIKALRVRDAASFRHAEDYPVAALLLDAWCDEQYGGTGTQFDWQLVAQLQITRPIILAGGLNPGNVAAAIRQVKPYAVDVSSGVESRPGCKDASLVAQFVEQVRNA
ncbi:MAG: phosphoribosylanthranilate isomerase [Pelovirga sp.]